MKSKFFPELNLSSTQNAVVFLDIDGTLTHDRLTALEEATIRQAQELNKNNTVYLCSNRNDHQRNRAVAQETGIEYLHTNLRKPSRKILKLIKNPDKNPLVVIGDKFLTDGLFAKRIGAKFIKVKRLESYRDGVLTKFLYWIDNLAAKLFS